MTDTAEHAVVLVHGLWMKRWTWSSFRRMLSEHGFKTYNFAYKTTLQPFQLSVLQLAAFVNSRPEQRVHLVVHSMGGVVAMQALPKINKPGKLLLLGSPIKGSRVAKKLQTKAWGRRLLKRANEPLTQGVTQPTVCRTSMMIAGTTAVGLGRLIERQLGPNDGTVALDETRANWLDFHEQVKTSHFGLLSNKEVMEKTLKFLNS